MGPLPTGSPSGGSGRGRGISEPPNSNGGVGRGMGHTCGIIFSPLGGSLNAVRMAGHFLYALILVSGPLLVSSAGTAG